MKYRKIIQLHRQEISNWNSHRSQFNKTQ